MQENVRQFRERWQAVARVEEQEQRIATLMERWQRTNTILCMAMALGCDLHRHDDDDVVYLRWARLKDLAT